MSTLHPYFYAYNPQLLAYENAWVSFVKEDIMPEKVISDDILSSWIRCKASGKDPLKREPVPLIPMERLNELIEENKSIIVTAMPFMKKLYDQIKETDFCIYFADRNGYILEMIAPESLSLLCRKTLSCPGADRSEKAAGTNAINLAINRKKAMQVSGAEHYLQQYHRWSCSAAPILDADNEVLGVICVAGHYEQIHKHSIGMVSAVTYAIQNELHITQINRQLEQNNNQLNAIFGMMTDGVIYAIDGRISQVNSAMCSLLGMKEKDIINERIENVVSTTPNIRKLMDSKRNGENREVVLEGKGRICNCLFDIKDFNEENGNSGEMIVFTQVEEIQMMASHIMTQRHHTFSEIVGESDAIKETISMAKKAALFNSRVIIQGESGTGKELLAQAIHNYSSRRYNSFIAVDCGAIPKELFESELFGYERGAFTGARKEGKTGLIELANKGTLFLDEIGNMPLDMQVKLLRTLQEGTINKVGGTEPIEVDVRIIAATNIDIQEAINNGTFRKDLFYRLNVVHITVPSLKERKEDIPLLTQHFVDISASKKHEMNIEKDAMSVLMDYDWPGNIRELNNIIERAIIMSDGKKITVKDLPFELRRDIKDEYNIGFEELPLEKMVRKYIINMVENHNGNISETARALEVSRNTVYKALENEKNDI